ncbi:MAG: YkgJ family cysteine cluster protein [Polyangiaceae bacterium]|nr:YkgJ family cysteine cluster protein [Polyangiaceae bacterium]MCW5790914.1 YkgJ family cysteine cluster protein [Polyangiaceae bacterium]
MASRRVDQRYRDPLELIWLGLAERLGLRIERSDAVFASYDGDGALTLCRSEHFDADDSLAQLIFHEVCHALVAGQGGLERADWGMGQDDAADFVQEHACHRLQARLAGDYGLRRFFAVTTDHRPHWDALPLDPLRSRSAADDAAVDLARLAYHRALTGPWSEHLTDALRATRAVALAVSPYAPQGSLWRRAGALHPSGLPYHAEARRCGDCAWARAEEDEGDDARRTDSARQLADTGEGDARRLKTPAHEALRCLRCDELWVAASERACEGFEARFGADECERCGACCREGFHRVELALAEPFHQRHPELVSRDDHSAYLARPGGRCVALRVTQGAPPRYRCAHYTDRPRACADFEVGGDACFEARRRVGLSE